MTQGTSASTELVEQDLSGVVDQLIAGKDLNEILRSFASDRVPAPTAAKPASVAVPAMSEEQSSALARLPEVYGVVAPSKPRLLTKPELGQIFHERELLDVIGDLVEQRKSTGIREAVAHHLDRQAERDGLARPEPQVEAVGSHARVVAEATPRDERGHYLLAGEAPVEGTGHKFTRETRGGGFDFSSQALHSALKAGRITRDQYNALTSVPVLPPPPRQFDEGKARAAIAKDPELLLVLAEHGTVPRKTTAAIYVRKDK